MTNPLAKKGHKLIIILISGWIGMGLILITPILSHAQVEPFSVSSPPNPVGSGARALGIAGAFVAVADDATAASWNPAGLIQLQKPEVSVVYSLEKRLERRYSLLFPQIEGEDKTTLSDLNYLSVAYPFNLAQRNFVFSLNYQRMYDFYREMRIHYNNGSMFEFQAKGTLYTLSPAFAVQATEDLFLGVTLNFWSDDWTGRSEWKNTLTYVDPNIGWDIREEYKNFRGVNANVGLLYRINSQWTIGAVIKIPFRGRLDYIYQNSIDPNFDAGTAYGKIESIDLPPTYALGVSYRVSDAWTVSADITRRDWDEMVWHNSQGQSFGLFTAFDPNDGTVIGFPKIDPTYSVRLGVEYLAILEKTVIPFRGGIFYDPIPSVSSPHSEYGFSVGSGLSIGDLILDYAYQYRARYDVPGPESGLWPGIFEDKIQHSFLFSAIYHF